MGRLPRVLRRCMSRSPLSYGAVAVLPARARRQTSRDASDTGGKQVGAQRKESRPGLACGVLARAIAIVMSAEEQRCEVAEVATPRIPHVPAGALDELVLDLVLVEQRAR